MSILQDVMKLIASESIDKMNEDQKAFFDKLMIADDAVRLYGPGKKARNTIMLALNCAPATANNYIQQAQSLIGSTVYTDKKYWKSWAIEGLVKTKNALERKIFKIDEETKEITDDLSDTVDPKWIKEYRELIAEIRATIAYDVEDEIGDELPPAPETVMITDDPTKIGLKPVKMSIDEIMERYGRKKQ